MDVAWTGTSKGITSRFSADLQFLIDRLEEESVDAANDYLHRVTLETLKDQGTSQALMGILMKAPGDRDDMEI